MKICEYEGMFLLDNAAASADFDGTSAQVDRILEKHGAEVVHKELWDERKLAYEIKGHRRATYYLIYFRAPTQALTEIDTDLGLNEVVLRHLTFALEEPMDDHIAKQTADREKMAEESRKSALAGWGDRKRGDRDRDRDRGGRRDRERARANEEGAAAAEGKPPAAGEGKPAAAEGKPPAAGEGKPAAPAAPATPTADATPAAPAAPEPVAAAQPQAETAGTAEVADATPKTTPESAGQ